MLQSRRFKSVAAAYLGAEEVTTMEAGRVAGARVAAAREAMARRGLDVLLLVSGPNLSYFSGYPAVERTAVRPFYLVLPRSGDLAMVVHSGRALEARRFSWVGNVRVYERLGVPPLEVLIPLLAGQRLSGTVIGMELGGELRLGLSVADFEQIREGLSPARVVDASPAIWDVRLRKDATEIAAIRSACAWTATAYERTFASLVPGAAESAVRARMLAELAEFSGDGWAVITSGQGNYDLATGPGTPRVVEPGDMVWLDAGCSFSGFSSDFSRAAVIGAPSPEQAEAHHAICEITRAAVALVTPGRPVSEIAAYCDDAIARLGVALTSSVSGLAGRVGHGLGLSTTEPPSLAVNDPTVLEAGMVVTIEPGFATEFGIFHVEQNVAVTDGGPDVLSAAPWELHQAGYPIGRQ
jgi:Xaa-Pro dipeptidase